VAEPQSFAPVKLICGIISSQERVISRTEERLLQMFGPIDRESPMFPFDFTDYYEKQMGENLFRKFLSFGTLVRPESLDKIKIETIQLEKEIQEEWDKQRRVVNIDPGYLATASLIMATAKNFAHRIPLGNGIYAHLELMFGKDEVRLLEWTYPDFQNKGYHEFFLDVRRIYLSQLKKEAP
jgi:hypothetical protein